MEIAKEKAYNKIKALVERFSEHIEEYKRNNYNEHQTRIDYINPFFKALGWDMDNEQGHAEAYREVIHEDKVKVGSSTKAPDYGFTLFGQRKFFVDAKKPAINIKGDIAPAYQVRRYGWSAKVPISIVTDFEEFSIYDCTKKPKPTDKASVSRIKYITYDQYLDEFDFFWDVFAKENLPKGRFDKYVQSDTRRKGTATVDDEFLKSIEQWRTYLATTIALRNKSLNEDEINYAVQKIIDRIIFLRMCEDRGVEQYGDLKKAAEKGDIYQNLFALYRMADDKYNSGLFDFKEDKITPTLTVDNKVMKNIIKELYYPNCEYEFSVMPADILGSVYERFLGKTIRLTKAHHAKIEEKPEVRKAGGVYYTPKYVVDYIVENTVGKLTEGKTPEQVKKIRICDPACGSGSFLIGAFQFLLDWHLKYYTNNPPTKRKKDNPLTPDGNLTTAEKKRILLNNIFGVDIDTQAVEVTKLNLLLKALEGETHASIRQQLTLFHERVLPNINQNIKCGNSLIGNDFYDDKLNLFPEQMKKINAFDWAAGFPEILKQGGFDAVIGNPPYVFGRDWRALGIGEDQKRYLGTCYKSSPYQLDMFSIFMEKAIELCAIKGYVGYIVPNVWLTNTYSSSTRSLIFQNSNNLVLTAPPKNVFPRITVDTIIYTLSKSEKTGKIFTIKRLSETNLKEVGTFETSKYVDGEEPISTSLNNRAISLLNKIKDNKKPLGDLADITRGVHPYRVGGYGKSAFQDGHQIKRDVDERPYHCQQLKTGFRPFIYGKDLKRFCPPFATDFIKYGPWLAEPRNPKFFEGDRIYSRKILGPRLKITIEKGDTVADQQVYITKPNLSSHSIEYYAAILGSSMMAYFIRNYFDEGNDAFPQIKVGQLKSLPIVLVDLSDKNQKEVHDKITNAISNLFKLNAQLNNTKLETQRQQIQRTINHTERKIDELVFWLYELSEEEIETIENW